MGASNRVMGLFGSAPRYREFYALFERAGHNVERATGLLAELMDAWPDEGNRLRHEIKLLEEEGDKITHGVIRHLNLKAAGPFASPDAHKLISDLDDVVDFAEEVADFMGLYRVEAPTDQAVQLAHTLHASGSEIAAALSLLPDLPAPVLTSWRWTGWSTRVTTSSAVRSPRSSTAASTRWWSSAGRTSTSASKRGSTPPRTSAARSAGS